MTSKRTISASNETAFLDDVLRPIAFVRLDFSSGVQYYHTEIGPFDATTEYGTDTYIGIGDFGGLASDIIESVTKAAKAVQIALTAAKSAMINRTLVDDYFWRDADIWIGLMNSSGALIDDPESLFSGYMDKVDIELGQQTAQMVLNLESRGINGLTASDLRFTDEDKQAETSGDLFGEYIFAMRDATWVWGKSVPLHGSGGVHGGGGIIGRQSRR